MFCSNRTPPENQVGGETEGKMWMTFESKKQASRLLYGPIKMALQFSLQSLLGFLAGRFQHNYFAAA